MTSSDDMGQALVWDVAMLGPSRVGKTSLLTALRTAGQRHFEGTPVSIRPEDTITKAAFSLNDNLMIGELAARRFSPESLPGDDEETTYGLVVETGVDDYRLILRFRDYPGGWLQSEKSDRVAEILEDSSAVLVPIDATWLMESGAHEHLLPRELALSEVEDNVREWAKRRRAAGAPALLILAPVKCESYFSDNGGRSNRSDVLFDRAREHYASVVAAYLKEYGAQAEVLYAPVDTIGPIEIMDVEWAPGTGSAARMVPTYRVRLDSRGRTAPRSIMGAEPILAYLMRDVLQLLDDVLAEDRNEVEQEIVKNKRANKVARSKWWKRFYDSVSGNQSARKKQRVELLAELTATDNAIRGLAQRASAVSPGREYARVRPWG